MKKLKVMTVAGTRPEIIRLSRVLAMLDQHCEHVLVHTGQNYDYELNQVFFDDLGVRKPDFFLNSAEGSTSAAHTIGNLITAVDGVNVRTPEEFERVVGARTVGQRVRVSVTLGAGLLSGDTTVTLAARPPATP
jgi:UDP-N-acetylglucosamine 2-epimerase (non-hydrolysing)